MERKLYSDSGSALVKANQFIVTLEELRKTGEAVKFRSNPIKSPIGSLMAVVTIDGFAMADVIGCDITASDCETYRVPKYQLVVGSFDEIAKAERVTKFKYQLHEGENFEKDGKITDWRDESSENLLYFRLGGWAWSKSVSVISFMPGGYIPPTYSSEMVKEALGKYEGFGGKFTPPSSFGDKNLASVAKGLKRCLNSGVLFDPSLESPHRHEVMIEGGFSYVDYSIYTLSQNGFSRLEKICSKYEI